MLKKMVDGIEVICSPEEEAVIRQYWDMNDKYPEYSGHLMFDGVNPPEHNMHECKKHLLNFMNIAVEKCVADINNKIQHAEESGDIDLKNKLISDRKIVKSLSNPDLSDCKTVEHLKNSIPERLQFYF